MLKCMLLALSLCTTVLCTSAPIIFGQSAVISGPSQALGIEMRNGIQAAFKEINNYGGAQGRHLQLITLDDAYDPVLCYNNTVTLVNDSSIFALLGYVGTPTSVAALPLVINSSLPFIGAYTGTTALRTPFNPNIINIRASYNDETAAMIAYMYNQRQIRKISIFYQLDSFGLAGYTGLTRAMGFVGLKLVAQATFVRNTLDIEAGSDILAQRGPDVQAIVMIGTYAPLAKFVRYVKQKNGTYQFNNPDKILFLTVSFVGAEAFAAALGDDFISNVIVTQVVPPPSDTTNTLAKKYQNAMKSLFGTYAYTYASFEGYIAAQTVAAGLQDAISNLGYNNITSKNFIDALYDTQEYYISGEKIGPYYKNCITNTSCGCNQGLRKIWPTFVRPNITFQLITEAIYSWSGACIADTTSIPIPLVFGQSAALTGAAAYTGNSMRAGILAAFLEYNNAGGYNGRSVQLESMDDKYDGALCVNNTLTLINDFKVFALTGYVGTPTATAAAPYILNQSMPLIGIFSGARFLRNPWTRYYINVRASYDDEALAMVNYLVSVKLVSRISFLKQNDESGDAAYLSLTRAMSGVGLTIESIGSFAKGATDISAGLASISQGNPEAIVMIGTAATLAIFIKAVKDSNSTFSSDPSKLVLFTFSFASSSSISQILLSYGSSRYIQNVFITEAVLYPYDDHIPLFNTFYSSLNATDPTLYPSTTNLEGYLSGKMITATLGLLRASGATLTRKTFLDVLYASRTFSFNGVTLGEYSNLCESNSGSCCNTGGRSVIIVRVKSTATRNSIVYSDLVEKVPGADLKYTSCIADPSIVPLPIMFAQVAANISVVGSSTYNYALGVKAAFFAQNYIGGISGRYLALKTYDGHGKSWIMSKDLWAALNRDRVVACLGVYSPTNETLLQEYSYNSTITFLGPLSGSMALRTPFNRNIINIRPSIRDEMAAIANFLHKVLQLSNVVLLVQTTSLIQVWEDGVRGYIDFASNVHGMSPAIIRYTTAQDTSVINQIIQAKDAQAFVLLGSTSSIHGYATLAANISQKLVIAAPNDVDYTQLVSLTGKVLAGRLYVSQLVNLGTSARSLDASAPITGSVLAKRFMDAMNNSEFLTSVQIADGTPFMTNAALEGFIVGRLAVTATQHALAMSTATSTTSANEREAEARALFLEAMYDIASFTVDGFKLGPLGDACVSTSAQQDQCGPSRTNCDCSQMAGSVFISQASVDDPTIMVSRPDGTYSFSTCGVMLPPTIFSFVYIIVIVAVLSVVLVVIVLIVLLIIWRAKKSHSVLYAPSSGLAVLAFTDVQNSTVLWQDFPREMRTALKAHNQIMRKLLKRFRGHEVKTQGDSFMVAFTAPLDALDWAMSVQVELTKYEHWPSDLLLHSYDCRTEWDEKRNIIFKGLRVRIGLHYGEVERLTDPTSGRPDYFGTTVNKAARIEGLAKGGQVLLSSELFDELKPVMFNAITNISAVEEFSEFTDENFTPRQEDTQSKGSANSYKRNKYVINSPSGTMSPDGISYRERTNSSSTATEDFKRAILRQRRISATTKNLDSHYVLYRHYGEHMLKGLSEPNVIFEVFVAELKGRTFDTPQAGETPATPNVARKNVSYIDTSQNERFGTHIDSPVEEDDRHVTLTVPKITHANQVMPV